MTGVRFCKMFSHEYVTEVTVAVGARNLDPHTVRVGFIDHRSRYLFVERGPAAMGVELVHGPVEFSVALPANISARIIKVVIHACERVFGALHSIT